MSKWRVYISSTFRDLEEFRSELRTYFEKQLNSNFELCKIMERMFDDGTYAPVADECIEEVQNCDIYILILANKVGSFPPEEARTYTEIELDTAIKNNKRIFCFYLEPFVESEIDNKVKHQEILEKFRGRPKHSFKNLDKLKLIFLESLIQYAAQSPINKRNPYKGLTAFDVVDGDYFFGRNSEIEECLKKIVNNTKFISIIGNSGIGKTSFVQAGILSRLRKMPELGFSDFEQIVITPGIEPFSNLKYQLSKKGITLDNITNENYRLHKIILFFNQFEEIISQCHTNEALKEREQLFEFLDHISLNSACQKTIQIYTAKGLAELCVIE